MIMPVPLFWLHCGAASEVTESQMRSTERRLRRRTVDAATVAMAWKYLVDSCGEGTHVNADASVHPKQEH